MQVISSKKSREERKVGLSEVHNARENPEMQIAPTQSEKKNSVEPNPLSQVPYLEPNSSNQNKEQKNELSFSELYQHIPQLVISDSQRKIKVLSKHRPSKSNEEDIKKAQTTDRKIHRLGRSNIRREEQSSKIEPVEKRLTLTEKKKQIEERDIAAEEKEQTILSAMREQPTKAGIHLLYRNEAERV